MVTAGIQAVAFIVARSVLSDACRLSTGPKREHTAMPTNLFEPFPLLSTSRLVLRCLVPDDAEAMFHCLIDPDAARFAGRAPSTSATAVRDKIDQILTNLRDGDAITWALTDAQSNAYLGSAGLWRWDKGHFRAEVGYEIARHFRGRGLMPEALRPILAFGFERMQLHSVEAKIHPDNSASIRVLEKLGFRKEAHFRENHFNQGVFEDTVVYSLLAGELS
jgi:[ribosomal protein S5]-alanine N-acetyltransferase